MKQKLLFLILLLSCCTWVQNIQAQTLSAGDIAMVGYHTDVDDGFTFIALTDIPAGEVIYFTDKGWKAESATWYGNTEDHIVWTAPGGGLPIGTIVSIIETASDTFTVTQGTAVLSGSDSGFSLLGGDSILAYQSSSGAEPASPTFIAGIYGDDNYLHTAGCDDASGWHGCSTCTHISGDCTSTSTSTSGIPAGLTNGVNALALFPFSGEEDNAKYTGTLTGTVSDVRAAINDYTNWTTSDNPVNIHATSYPATSITPDAPACTMTAAITSQTNIACNGGSTGSLTVTATNGDSNYNYVWTKNSTFIASSSGSTSNSNTLSAITAGTYQVAITDGNGCTATASATITQPTVLNLTPASQTNIACNGGSTGAATVNAATGGAGGYTYNWTPGNPTGDGTTSVSGLSAGTWTCTVTDTNGCTATQSFTVTQPTAGLSASIVATGVSCNGGSNGTVDLTVTGGTAPYNFEWNNTATTEDMNGLIAGTYNVTITDANGCTTTASATVTEPTTLNVTPASQTNIACNGGSTGAATVNAATGGAGGYTYNWTPGNPTGDGTTSVSGLSAGTWTCTVTDTNGCTATQSFTVTQPATALNLTPASQTNIDCNGGATGAATVNAATGGAGGYTYNWTPGNPTGDGTTSVSGLTAGTWTVTATDANGCTDTQLFTITQPASSLSANGTVDNNVSSNGGYDGAATVSASGGTAPYSYLWTSGHITASVTNLAAGTYQIFVTDNNGCTATVSVTITEPAPCTISAAASASNVSCNGSNDGTVDLTITGGTAPYTYLWSNTATTEDMIGLTAGTYDVTVTDANGCTATESVDVLEPTVLSANAVAGNVSCNAGNDGTVDLTVTGGTAPYTYAWSNTATTEDMTGLTAGTYNVTVTDANGCTTTSSTTVTEPTALTASAIATNVSCNGGNNGTIDLTVTGGTAPYSYAWSNTATTEDLAGLMVGTYDVTVTDANGCTTNASTTVTEPTALSASAIATDVSCNAGSDGTVDLTVSGGTAPYTYAWSNTATTEDMTGLMAGTYDVTITDANGCTTTVSATVTEPTALSASAIATNVSCNAGNDGTIDLTVTGGTAPYTYAWSNSATTEDMTGLTAGTYDVTITDANGCTTTASATVTEPTALTASAIATNVSCNAGNDGTVDLTVTGGTAPYTYAWSNTATTEDLAGLMAGTYDVTITDANGCTITASATVTEPTALSASAIATNVSCNAGNDGTIDLTVTGGTAPYTYAWSNSATTEDMTGLTAGTYDVTITDANGCTTTASVTVTEPTALTASAIATNVSCNAGNDGTVDLTVTGGTAPYTYAWSNTATTEDLAGLMTGTYDVTVTDANGCTTTASATIMIADDEAPTAICQDITISLDSTGNVTITAQDVDNGSTDNCSIADYQIDVNTFDCSMIGMNQVILTVTDNNGNVSTCTSTVTVVDDMGPIIDCLDDQTVMGNPNENFFTVPDFVANGDVTAVDNCDGTITSISQNPTVGTLLSEGEYNFTFIATDQLGNTSVCVSVITVDTDLKVDANALSLKSLSLFPNPARNQVILVNKDRLGMEEMEIYDLHGRLVKRVSLLQMTAEKTIDISNLQAAAYMVMIKSKDNNVIVKRLLKE